MTTWARENGWTGNLCDMVIKVIGMLIPMLWTYPCNRFLIHRKRKKIVNCFTKNTTKDLEREQTS